MAGARMMPIFVMKTMPLKSAYSDEKILPDLEVISITGPIPLKIIEAL